MGSAWLVVGGGLAFLFPAMAEAAYLKGDGCRAHQAGPVTAATVTERGTWKHLRMRGQSRGDEDHMAKAVRHSGSWRSCHMGAIRELYGLTFGEHDDG